MNFDFIPASTRAAGLGALMKGAGKLLRFVPIPQRLVLDTSKFWSSPMA